MDQRLFGWFGEAEGAYLGLSGGVGTEAIEGGGPQRGVRHSTQGAGAQSQRGSHCCDGCVKGWGWKGRVEERRRKK